jgi:hypothetical protein
MKMEKMLKRSLQTLTAMGVKRIVLMNSYRVEKSFWQSPWLAEDKLREQLVLGLEQARDTWLPDVIFEKRFKPFVEDRLPSMLVAPYSLPEAIRFQEVLNQGATIRYVAPAFPAFKSNNLLSNTGIAFSTRPLVRKVVSFPTRLKSWKLVALNAFTWAPEYCE